MAKASDNQFPKVTFAESAAPSTPASGLAVVYVKSDGKLYLKDDAGVETDLTASGSAGVTVTQHRRTSGDFSLTNTTSAAVNSATDLVIAAVAGDWLEISANVRVGNEAVQTNFDVATIVSAAAVNWFSSGSGTPAAQGLVGWVRPGGAYAGIGEPATYQVQSGDISGGNVTLRLYAWVSAASPAKTLFASTNNPFQWTVKNLG